MTKDITTYGFIVKHEEYINEIQATVRIMEHKKSGAKLMHIKNNDRNKTFSIAFRTPPSDSTGLPHILEHSVLCGSRKFPVKEPFVELAKGSLNTYLNAMTYSDKTMYPISSQNDKDFINLMDVYLDAVFFPNIYKNPMILMQEGWHYKLENSEDEIEYQGVVYNEMKGAFSSPEGVLFRKVEESLFPDTPYSNESGGDPEYIPDLTQEQFLEFHTKYYHPSNSYICLYGDGDIDKHLEFIDKEYLSHFEKINIDSEIPKQLPFSTMVEQKIKYPIAPNESEENKTYFALNFVIGDSDNKDIVMAFQILQHLLLDTPAAPLKKALIDANIGQDVFGVYNTSIRQPVFSIVVKNASIDQKDKFKQLVISTLNSLIEEGIDKKLIEGAINSKEFELREADFRGYSKGLLYAIQSLKSWLYDGDPLRYLKYEEDLTTVKQALTTQYFEEMIQKYILNNQHASFVIMEPDKDITHKKEAELKEKLKEFKKSLTKQEIENLIANTKKLQEMQITSDKEEELEKIPMLSLTDLDKQVDYPEYSVNIENKVPFIFTSQPTNQIAYINMYYDLKGVEKDIIQYIGLLIGMLGKLDTKNYSYEDLNNKIDINTGGIQYSTVVFNDSQSPSEYKPMLVVSSKVLYSKLKYLVELLGEVLVNTKFNQKTRIIEIIREMKSRMEMSISNDGHRVAFRRLASYYSQKDYYEESLKGLSFFEFVRDLERDIDNNWDMVVDRLGQAYKVLTNNSRLIIGVTAEYDQYNTIKTELFTMLNSMDHKVYKMTNPVFSLDIRNEALLAPFNVQYVAAGYDFRQLGYKYSGSMNVLRGILDLDYLWSKVRVQNGAYGCFSSFGRSGSMFFASYRDPNISKTLQTYKETAEYIEKFTVSDRDMTKYIIGTISKLDFPRTPSMNGEMAQGHYISGITKEMLQTERDEVLSTNQQTIREFAPLVRDCIKQNYICVLGNHNKIKEEEYLFDHLIDIFK